VILRDGPHGVSVDAVLAESAMSKGGFFHHFPTKAAVLGGLRCLWLLLVHLRLSTIHFPLITAFTYAELSS
jgi:AcrR family transcriptional regulator